jgi:hypothetical protein
MLTRRLFCVHLQGRPRYDAGTDEGRGRLRLVAMHMGSTDFLKTTGFVAKKTKLLI